MPEDKTVGIPTGYRVTLSISERLNLGALFPQKGNMITNQIMEDLTEKVQLSQKEMDYLSFKTVEVTTAKGPVTRWTWDPDKAEEKQFELSKTEVLFLKKRIEVMDKTEDITSNMWPLVKKLDAFKVSEEKN